MKKLLITSLAVMALVTTTTVTSTPMQTAHASLIYKVMAATYLYEHRHTLEEMVAKARSYTHSSSFPHFKAGANHNGTEDVYVVTKTGQHNLGAFPTKAVQVITNADKSVKSKL